MGRMYGSGKGISKSSMPYKKVPPRWLSVDPNEVVKQIETLAKKGYKPSQSESSLEITMPFLNQDF